MKNYVAENIKRLREIYNLTQQDIADIAGVTYQAVSAWERGIKLPRMGAIQKIADHFNLNKSNIIEKNGMDFFNQTDTEGAQVTQLIKVYGKICAGNGKLAYEDPIDEIYNPYPRLKGKLIALQVDGDSMNKIISDGDYAIIRLQPDVDHGQIAAVIIDGEEAMLKRVYKVDQETIVLKPESTEEYDAHIFVGEQINRIRIIGKLVGGVKPYIN